MNAVPYSPVAGVCVCYVGGLNGIVLEGGRRRLGGGWCLFGRHWRSACVRDSVFSFKKMRSRRYALRAHFFNA